MRPWRSLYQDQQVKETLENADCNFYNTIHYPKTISENLKRKESKIEHLLKSYLWIHVKKSQES